MRDRSRRLLAGLSVLAMAVTMLVTSPTGASATTSPRLPYPLGTPDTLEPSGMAPPGANALSGYHELYVNDFRGNALPAGWGKFNGVPKGDPGSRWAPSHVLLGGGIVRLIAYRDPRFAGQWTAGGISQYSLGRAYGAYFIRSRATGPGPDENELLWPVAPVWPPEVDLNEMGYRTNATSWTVHYGHGNTFVQTTKRVNMERWHTFGVVWTPTSLTFTVDGHPWGHVTKQAVVPHVKMMLDVQQQIWCSPRLACPRKPAALQIDWVAEYARS